MKTYALALAGIGLSASKSPKVADDMEETWRKQGDDGFPPKMFNNKFWLSGESDWALLD